jgi:ABC-2 type transport system permease protein
VSAVPVIAGYALREALRRKVFAVVLVLTLVFLVLYWLATSYLFDHLDEVIPPVGVDARTLVGSTVLGLAMFATMFLGVVLAIFLTLGVVRGDAERGLLQPRIVRPVTRGTLLAARLLGAASVCVPYVLAVYGAAVVITRVNGDWMPDRTIVPGLELAFGVVIVAAIAILGSVFLTTTANGIAVFMVFGAGLVAGLLGQIGDALNSHRLERIAVIASWAAPFEALYRDALHNITADTTGLTRFVVQLGPFGGGHEGGPWLGPWAVGFLVLCTVFATAAFTRSDL